jgi:hypothetical protein
VKVPFIFTLRTLFIALTVICCFLAYQVSWIHARRRFLSEQWLRHQSKDVIDGTEFQVQRLYRPYGKVANLLVGRPPGLLGFLGEEGHKFVVVVIPESEAFASVPVNNGTSNQAEYWSTEKQSDYARARRLFPEARIYPYVRDNRGDVHSVNIQRVYD